MNFQVIIDNNINIINLLNWLKKNIRIWLFDNQFMRNIQNFLCHLIFIKNYQNNLNYNLENRQWFVNHHWIKLDKIYKLIELWVIDNDLIVTDIWNEFLRLVKENIENYKIIDYRSFVKEIIISFDSKQKSPDILNKYFWKAHSDEIVYILLKTLKNNNFFKYIELKTYIYQLINNSNINLFDKIENEEEFYLVFFQKIFYWNIEDNTILRINWIAWKNWFKDYLNKLYKEYNNINEILRENEDFIIYMKENYKEVYNIISRVDYQPEIYSQPFSDIKALLFLELRN